MRAIITGDIINSQETDSENWLPKLKELLGKWGKTPSDWEVYRGDEFQLKCSIDGVFWKALSIKSLIKQFENLDVRIAIGIGEEQYSSEKITESNGTAYVNSGRLLNEIKNEGKTFAIKTPNEGINADFNILFKWSSLDFDSWTVAVSEIVHLLMMDKNLTQDDLAKKLNISQSSVSQRIKRANFDLILETDYYFRKKIAEL
ncbi:winged helix-turn-helix transcriptional regulator [Candidatus Kaistella beijingensis]|uniref:SatD family protein n=1 Tax=Candidatus Kaistella beijingensis TaxID=2820270 RepID=UPI001CC39199|nr:SatD family protein [Candidatus Kaistella beijingensis]UBB90475.1 winged helix-turn-helix transcriptional regulator [Candidatus Kaistella beijingensis]